jgi:Ca2+-binding EF-hand superfamily protein
MRKFQLVAFMIMGASILIPFPTTTVAQRPEPLPWWFKEVDENGDGQITLQEWRNAGGSVDEFRQFDLNGDGIVTPDEVHHYLKKNGDLKLTNGHATYNGIVEQADETYRGKISFKVLTVKLEQGNTYEIDHVSQAFQAFLYLEDSEGNLLEENSSPTIGGNSRIVFRPEKTAIYRIIVTSAGGFRTGHFVLSVRLGVLPDGLPPWFRALDQDGDGQITLQEWRKAGKSFGEFRRYDLNGDGILTADEVLRYLKLEAAPKPAKGPTRVLPEGLPPWFRAMDQDGDGQITLKEWRNGGKPVSEFRQYDLNGDGILTADEVLHFLKKAREPKPDNGPGSVLPKGLPSWFKALDKDGDGQITLQEWRNAAKPVNEFRQYDLNGDGIITSEEVLRYLKKPVELKLNQGQSTYNGTVEEADEVYRDKKSFKVFIVRLEQGRTYQIDLVSEAFQAFLFLEDFEGNLLEENSSRNVGGNSRIVFRPEKTGTYRVIATSAGGFRTGPFVLSVRSGVMPKGLPSWFRALDKDGDGQITLQEWREGGNEIAEFRQYDLNGDGIITADEVLRYLKLAVALKLSNGQATYHGTLEEADETYRGKKSFKVFTIKVEKGKTYQIDHISKAYQAFLYLEDADGNPLAEDSSSNIGGNSRIVVEADKDATLRVIATSLGGYKTGDCLLSVRVIDLP